MALLHIEGFDNISDNTGSSSQNDVSDWINASKYHNLGHDVSLSNAVEPEVYAGWGGYGQALSFGDNFLSDNGFLGKQVSASGTLIVGFAIKPGNDTQDDNNNILTFSDYEKDLDNHISLRLFQGRHLQILSGGSTYLGVALNVLTPDRWSYIEFKVTFSNSVGAFELRSNGMSIISDTNVDTVSSSGVSSDFVAIRGVTGHGANNASNQTLFDDWYICDTTGAANNDFLGPIKVESLLPNASGDDSDWTPSAGSNFENVNEVPEDGSTTYNESSTSGHLDLFNAPSLVFIDGDIFGVVVESKLTCTAAQALGCTPTLKSSTTEGAGTTEYVTDDHWWVEVSSLFEEDPNATAAWTVATINSMQFGYEVA
jgi:hypothetical protein